MKFSSQTLEKAVEALASLPSIGRKTALRLAIHLVQDSTDKSIKIAEALTNLSENIKYCKQCFNISDHEVCDICTELYRDKELVCVVESVRDVMAIEETGQYRGLYHVLGGVISPMDGVGPGDLNIDELVTRVAQEDIKEIIMAISPTIEGETTIFYISKKLKEYQIILSTIARGVSFGGDLEYADELTLGRSIVSRTPYSSNT